MKREIKFRIWNGQKYFYPEAKEKEANHYLQFGSDGFWFYNSDGKLISSTMMLGVCEQFTGLTDKNGEEIYEGDLFKNSDYIYQVVYENGAFYLKHISLKEGNNWGLLNDLINHSTLYKDFFDATDLIGNIHENSELL